MPLRRRAWLSKEGVYYLGVLAFIVGGAVLRSFNLLVILSGMMMALLLLNWRIVMATLRGLSASRKLPEQVIAGQPLTVEITVENTRRSLGAWLVTVEDWVERVPEPGVGSRRSGIGRARLLSASSAPSRHDSWWQRWRRLVGLHRTHCETVAAQVPARGSATASYRLTLPRRGRYRFGPLRISTRYPFGLVWGHVTISAPAELVVAPRLGRLLPNWAELLEAEVAGDQRRHPQRGISEGDYYGLRPWQPGDSTRWIHWRATAKLGRPTVLQFERQRSRDVALLLDAWLPDQPRDEDLGRLELAISLAATAVADLTSRGQAHIVLAVAGHEPQCWSGPASPRYCHEVLGELATLAGTSTTSLELSLHQVRHEATTDAKFIIISPRQPQLAPDPHVDHWTWIDVSSPELSTLFTLA